MKFENYLQKLLKNEKFKKEYEKNELNRNIAIKVMEIRTKMGITQKELAELIGTKQPSIARLENGESLPSVSFLNKIAIALKIKIGDFFNKSEPYIYTINFSMPINEKKENEITTNSIISYLGSAPNDFKKEILQ